MAQGDKRVNLDDLKTAYDRLNLAEFGMNGAVAIAASGDPEHPTDLDTFKTPGVFIASNTVASGLANSPTKSHFRLFVMYGSSTNNNIQVLFDRAANTIWTRTFGTNVWSSWTNLLDSVTIDSKTYVKGFGISVDSSNYERSITDMNNAEINQIYHINGVIQSITNHPADERGASGMLMSIVGYRNETTPCFQFLMMNDGKIWRRIRTGGVWGAWELISDSRFNNERYYLSTCVDRIKTRLSSGDKVIVFGDSIARRGWSAKFASETGATVLNKAVEGAAYGHTASSIPSEKWISTEISGCSASDWSGVKVVFIGAGTNDAAANMDATEFKTQVKAAIDAINAAAPDAHIVVITPIRRADNNTIAQRLSLYAGIAGYVALTNGCSVINGFDFPIPVEDVDGGVIEDLTLNNGSPDHLHPGPVGQAIYSRFVIGATQ